MYLPVVGGQAAQHPVQVALHEDPGHAAVGPQPGPGTTTMSAATTTTTAGGYWQLHSAPVSGVRMSSCLQLNPLPPATRLPGHNTVRLNTLFPAAPCVRTAPWHQGEQCQDAPTPSL